jgi:hypothetical protein
VLVCAIVLGLLLGMIDRVGDADGEAEPRACLIFHNLIPPAPKVA